MHSTWLRLAVLYFAACQNLSASNYLPYKAFPLSDVNPPTAENVSQETKERLLVAPAPDYPPDRLFEFGLAFGFPIVAAPEIGIQLFKRFQFGTTFGLLPSGIVPQLKLPTLTETLNNGFNVDLNPVADSSFLMVSPFVRYFPTPRMFYFQLTWTAVRSTHLLTSDITDDLTNTVIPGASLNSTVTMTAMLPTLSIGYFFWRHVYFFNISLGATVLLTATNTVDASVTLPAALGGALSNQAVTASIQSQIDQIMNQAVVQIRNTVPFVPSIMISTGLMF